MVHCARFGACESYHKLCLARHLGGRHRRASAPAGVATWRVGTTRSAQARRYGDRMPVTAPAGEPLVGRFVRLDALAPADAEGLHEVYADPAVYEQGFIMRPPPADLAETRARLEQDLAARPGRTAYTVRLTGAGGLGEAGTVVGTSSLGDVDLANERIHLGWTMYGSRWWGSEVNPECKLLLLGHAFDCGFGRVKIQTDAVNERSQAAIARLGATREGVLRRHSKRADGTFRDTVVFSVLRQEWPAVRAGLEQRLGMPRG
jgi:N-acetyltransferase